MKVKNNEEVNYWDEEEMECKPFYKKSKGAFRIEAFNEKYGKMNICIATKGNSKAYGEIEDMTFPSFSSLYELVNMAMKELKKKVKIKKKK